MRFISKYRGYSLVALPTITIPEANMYGGKARRGIVCDFQWVGRGCSSWEIEEGLRAFKFSGLGHDEDPAQRLSYYDTDEQAKLHKWDADTKKQVEERLLNNTSGGDYVLVEPPKAPIPWASYAKLAVHGRRTAQMVAEKVAAIVEDTGVEPGVVIAYEKQNDRPGSPEIIRAMEALVAREEEGDPTPLIAA